MTTKTQFYYLLLSLICCFSFQLKVEAAVESQNQTTSEQKVIDYDSTIGIGFSEKQTILTELPKTGDSPKNSVIKSSLPQTNNEINPCLTYLGVTLVIVSMIYKYRNGRKDKDEKEYSK